MPLLPLLLFPFLLCQKLWFHEWSNQPCNKSKTTKYLLELAVQIPSSLSSWFSLLSLSFAPSPSLRLLSLASTCFGVWPFSSFESFSSSPSDSIVSLRSSGAKGAFAEEWSGHGRLQSERIGKATGPTNPDTICSRTGPGTTLLRLLQQQIFTAGFAWVSEGLGSKCLKNRFRRCKNLQGCDSFIFRCHVHHVHQSWWNALSAGEVAGGASPDKDFVSLLGFVWCVCMWAHNVRHCWSLEKIHRSNWGWCCDESVKNFEAFNSALPVTPTKSNQYVLVMWHTLILSK